MLIFQYCLLTEDSECKKNKNELIIKSNQIIPKIIIKYIRKAGFELKLGSFKNVRITPLFFHLFRKKNDLSKPYE